MKNKHIASKIYTTLVMLFLYLPIFVLIIFSTLLPIHSPFYPLKSLFTYTNLTPNFALAFATFLKSSSTTSYFI